MKRFKVCLILLLSFLLTACEKGEDPTFCKEATAKSFSPHFKVFMTGVGNQLIPLKHACPPTGEGISPAISWEGLPSKATRLHILVEDATCTYMCNGCCKYHHWQLDIPLDDPSFPYKQGLPENASIMKELQPYILPNTSDKKAYMPFCPPKDQMHAIVIQLTAYHTEGGKKIIDGRSQSRPYLIALDANIQ